MLTAFSALEFVGGEIHPWQNDSHPNTIGTQKQRYVA